MSRTWRVWGNREELSAHVSISLYAGENHSDRNLNRRFFLGPNFKEGSFLEIGSKYFLNRSVTPSESPQLFFSH